MPSGEREENGGEEDKQDKELNAEKEQKPEIDKLIEQKKIDIEIKERALRQQQRFQHKSDEDIAKEIMIKQIEEKRIEEEKKNRINKIKSSVLLIGLIIIVIIFYLKG